MPKTSRDPWLDNAKIWLVVVVVVGHMIVLMPPGDLTSRAYDFVYYFHIPAFVVITGYLSRTFRWTRRHLTSLLTMLVLPYIVFEMLMALWRVYVVGEVSDFSALWPLWVNPHWPMWYLAVLVMWRLATPILVRHWVAVPVSVVVSLVAGRWNIELFDINRALGLLPFFVLGLHLTPRMLGVVKARWSGLVGLAIFAGLWWLAGTTDEHWSTQWLYYRSPYDDLGVSFGEGVEIRAQLLAVGLAGSFAALSLLPTKENRFSVMGAWTMVVYLIHGFVVRGLEAWGYAEWMPDDEVAILAITVATGVALGLLLGWPPVAKRLFWLVDPVGALTRRRRERSGPTTPAAPPAGADPTPSPPRG